MTVALEDREHPVEGALSELRSRGDPATAASGTDRGFAVLHPGAVTEVGSRRHRRTCSSRR